MKRPKDIKSIIPGDLVAFEVGALERQYLDIGQLLEGEAEYGPGWVMGLTASWKILDEDVVGLVLHIFQGGLVIAMTGAGLRSFIPNQYESGGSGGILVLLPAGESHYSDGGRAGH